MSDLRTPEEWLADDEFNGVVVLDPDGWDRTNYDEDWAIPITRDVMTAKLALSTRSLSIHEKRAATTAALGDVKL